MPGELTALRLRVDSPYRLLMRIHSGWVSGNLSSSWWRPPFIFGSETLTCTCFERGSHLGHPWSYPWRVEHDQIHAAISLERRGIADLIESLDEAQLGTESLCTGWDVRTVAAHLVSPLADGTVRPLLLLGLRRGSLARVVDERARRRAQAPAAEIAATLRDLADHQYWYPPPQAASARLPDHGSFPDLPAHCPPSRAQLDPPHSGVAPPTLAPVEITADRAVFDSRPQSNVLQSQQQTGACLAGAHGQSVVA